MRPFFKALSHLISKNVQRIDAKCKLAMYKRISSIASQNYDFLLESKKFLASDEEELLATFNAGLLFNLRFLPT